MLRDVTNRYYPRKRTLTERAYRGITGLKLVTLFLTDYTSTGTSVAITAAKLAGSIVSLPMPLTHERFTHWRLAIVLAIIAGYVDGYGLLRLGTFVSFMSGNTTTAGVRTGQGSLHGALPSALAVVFFFTGSLVGRLLTESKLRYPSRVIFLLVAVLLAIACLESRHMRTALIEIATLSLAMGMMNPALSKVGGESMSLTFVTGTLKRTADHLALAFAGKPLQDSQSQVDSHLGRAVVEASLWTAFLGGAIIAAIVLPHAQTWALLPPTIMMGFAASLRWHGGDLHTAG